MADSDSRYYLSPNQQDQLSAQNKVPSKTSNRQPEDVGAKDNAAMSQINQQGTDDYDDPSLQPVGALGQLFDHDDSPYLDFDVDVNGEDQFDVDNHSQSIGEAPGDTLQVDHNELHEKRKNIDGNDDDDEGGGKRRESEGGAGKKPGRKALTAEPTSKRKAQNRAAQRAFRERKEKHLKDLETKVEDLEKASETTNHENGMLRTQVERLQIELKEYRKRLSWVSSNSQGHSPPLGFSAPGAAARKSMHSNNTSDFQFDFPRFGDIPATYHQSNTTNTINSFNNPTLPAAKVSTFGTPGVVGRNSLSNSAPSMPPPHPQSTGNSPMNATSVSPAVRSNHNLASDGGFDSFSGLFSPSILEAGRHASTGYFHPTVASNSNDESRNNSDCTSLATNLRQHSTSSLINMDSPPSSYASQQNGSSIGTSPEPSLSSPGQKVTDCGHNTINKENQLQSSYGGLDLSAGLDLNSFNWFAQQNGGGFDPVLFHDYREPQDAIASQDYGTFFNDALPPPELDTQHSLNEIEPSPPKNDLLAQVEAAQEGVEGVVPGGDTSKTMNCNKIWARLQLMEKFRNGEIDIDSLCSDMRAKARCSESGVVVSKVDIDKILGLA